ncbi:unnamed protein product [Adineta ricciae]|uniref:NmrA-like domain-containing protein n=1 Tax=Adineta ricciae TaxID=249248 RepID=A0A815AB05_ADIRI|nr:unnamed protein product [Adineta ricciae]CAF1254657.1 unnamed protein product [Adineta ricciae]
MADSNEMKKVVVAGGTGSVGRNIVDAIVATGKYAVIVFSRQQPSNPVPKGVTLIIVDYNDHYQLHQTLKNVHTVISCIGDLDESCRDAQIALLHACLKAGVKRFAPSEWAGSSERNISIELYTKVKKPVVDAVKCSGIEYTLFLNGLFMDYFASPQQSNPYLEPMPFGVDMNKCTARFVGTGDEPFNVTLLEDVGKFVAAALDLEHWELHSGIVGSRTSWNEVIRLGEKVREQKFEVERLTVDEILATRNQESANSMEAFYADAMIHFAQGEMEYEATLNEHFPAMQVTKIDEFIEKWWKNKQKQVL